MGQKVFYKPEITNPQLKTAEAIGVAAKLLSNFICY
jgi:hypothetical protein